MEWVEGLLTLLFRQLGPLGTICLLTTVYVAWLHHNEREDHKHTRDLIAADAERRTKLNQEFIIVLTEIKTLLLKSEKSDGWNH